MRFVRESLREAVPAATNRPKRLHGNRMRCKRDVRLVIGFGIIQMRFGVFLLLYQGLAFVALDFSDPLPMPLKIDEI
jgi:hypothetical protein